LHDANVPWPDRFLFTHVGRWEKGLASQSKYRQCSIRHDRFHLVNTTRDGTKAWQLFDVTSDPGETRDLTATEPDIVRRLDQAYDRWWTEILPCLENEDAVGPLVNPFKALYWKQFGGGPPAQPSPL
jgi:arylsulfatase